MTKHVEGTREEWLTARCDLLNAENGAHPPQRRARPATPADAVGEGRRGLQVRHSPRHPSLCDLFRGRSQLLVHHMMFPGSPSCASCADGYNGIAIHLLHHDVAMATVPRYPIEDLTAFKERMGWTVPYVSSGGSDFNYDFGVAFTDEEMAKGPDYNVHTCWAHADIPADELAAKTEIPNPNDMPPPDAVGMRAFAIQDDAVYHTCSAYTRGMDALRGVYSWLDRAPLGRNETDRWYRLNDEYEDATTLRS